MFKNAFKTSIMFLGIILSAILARAVLLGETLFGAGSGIKHELANILCSFSDCL